MGRAGSEEEGRAGHGGAPMVEVVVVVVVVESPGSARAVGRWWKRIKTGGVL